MFRKIFFGDKIDEEIIEALKTKRYSSEKIYSDILKVEFDIRFPDLAVAVIKYYEDGKLKEDVERIKILIISHEFSSVSPDVFVSAHTSKIIVENPNENLYAMAGEIITVLWSRGLKLVISYRK